MKFQEESKPIILRAPDDHALFGKRFVVNHFFQDTKWTPESRLALFQCMVDVLEKDKILKNVGELYRNRKRSAKFDILKKECRAGGIRLDQLLRDDCLHVRNILRKSKELARAYAKTPTNAIARKIDQRTFSKRRERDLLVKQKAELAANYEESVLELSKLQDRVKYEEDFIIPETVVAKEYRMELKNSETRLRALKAITRAYNTIRHTLYQDTLYYGPVLNSLEDDIKELGNFIQQVIRLGRPALKKVDRLVAEYKVLEEEARKSMQNRLYALLAARQKDAIGPSKFRTLVRRNSDFEINLKRYDRETSSMINLRKKIEDIENMMKELKKVTLSAEDREIHPSMIQQIRTTRKLKRNVRQMQMDKTILEDKFNRAEVVLEFLKFNVTDESNKRKTRIVELKKLISEQKKNRTDFVQKLAKRGELMTYLRYSINHFVDTVRNVSEPLGIARREYPNNDLRLPLLRFDAFAVKSFSPPGFEPNSEKLLKGIKDRVKLLMKFYKHKKAANEDEKRAQNEYHNAYLQNLFEKEDFDEQTLDVAQIFEDDDAVDPTIPTRKQIKLMSDRFVQEILKQQD